MKKVETRHHHQETTHRLARRALFGFLVTFLIARIMVFLIMSGSVTNMYFFLHGTHVHHLNYWIFLLSVVGGYSVFQRPTGLAAEVTAFLYGVALGLTFDEFGMWLHLGGSYWQRVSVDAVIVVAALMGLLAYARSVERLESRHILAFLVLVLFLVTFITVLVVAREKVGNVIGPKLQELEESSSP
jgi:hypothetical protein